MFHCLTSFGNEPRYQFECIPLSDQGGYSRWHKEEQMLQEVCALVGLFIL
jgi:hypothetical protein